MRLAGCQIIPINLYFHLQKCLEIFDKNSADKVQSKNYKGGKSDLPHAISFSITLHYKKVDLAKWVISLYWFCCSNQLVSSELIQTWSADWIIVQSWCLIFAAIKIYSHCKWKLPWSFYILKYAGLKQMGVKSMAK